MYFAHSRLHAFFFSVTGGFIWNVLMQIYTIGLMHFDWQFLHNMNTSDITCSKQYNTGTHVINPGLQCNIGFQNQLYLNCTSSPTLNFLSVPVLSGKHNFLYQFGKLEAELKIELNKRFFFLSHVNLSC